VITNIDYLDYLDYLLDYVYRLKTNQRSRSWHSTRVQERRLRRKVGSLAEASAPGVEGPYHRSIQVQQMARQR
jgi:hypothetical protein